MPGDIVNVAAERLVQQLQDAMPGPIFRQHGHGGREVAGQLEGPARCDVDFQEEQRGERLFKVVPLPAFDLVVHQFREAAEVVARPRAVAIGIAFELEMAGQDAVACGGDTGVV